MKIKTCLLLPAVIWFYLYAPAQTQTLTGKVLSEEGAAIAGATVRIKSSNNPATTTNAGGEFFISAVSPRAVLVITSIGYSPAEISIAGRREVTVTLLKKAGELDEVIVKAYGTTTKRYNTGSISKVSAEEISRQPVLNPLAALQGRVPGLVISQTSGVPGSAFNVEIRGRSSLDFSLSRNDPLFIIDGVSFEPGNLPVNQLTTAANDPASISQGGLSPLAGINPADIESIEVLKDADATAIYGSRGANGVILVTTKKGVAGKTAININGYSGWSKTARSMPMLDTRRYIAMRREAFANDGITPAVSNAPDLLVWDTTRYTDMKKLLTGGTAHNMNLQASVSGGSTLTQFRIGGGYAKEENVFPGKLWLGRASLQFNIRHGSAGGKFSITLSGNYSSTENNMIRTDLTRYINLPPNMLLYDAAGNINWSEKGVPFPSGITNPLAELLRKYKSLTENLSAAISMEYRLSNHLVVRSNAGYNTFVTDEHSAWPKAAIAPASSTLASATFAGSASKSWLVEPQAEYTKQLLGGRLNVLLGASLQQRMYSSEYMQGTNYTNDLLLHSIRAAGAISATNNAEQYRYMAIFARLAYNRQNKYLLNISGRRDGSSRFGPHKQFANFGAVGAGWIFSNEKFFQKNIAFISFGKLRGSYGTAGNDQIGNYKYLDLWSNTSAPYQGLPGLYPASLFNPDYNWEINRKLEGAVELGFLKDRILFSLAYYRNRSGNQLVNYRLPNQTGFSDIIRNLPALVQNTGIEISFSSKNMQRKNFTWSSVFTASFPKNKLIKFPGLASSSYASSYREGLSLNSYFVYLFTGVDPQTGLYTAADMDNNGVYDIKDREFLGNTDPDFYGGISNHISYKAIELDFFFDYRKQTGRSYQAIIGSTTPGLLFNQPVLVLDRWQYPGDNKPLQKFTTTSVGSSRLGNSNGVYSDASFARLKNISLSYSLPLPWLSRLKISSGRMYVQAQNLFVLTGYKGPDPETQNFYVLPPLKTIVAGIHLNF